MIGTIRKWIHGYRRWKEADRKGWAVFGSAYHYSVVDRDEKLAKRWCRNSNRLYRLTRGKGNPWRAGNDSNV